MRLDPEMPKRSDGDSKALKITRVIRERSAQRTILGYIGGSSSEVAKLPLGLDVFDYRWVPPNFSFGDPWYCIDLDFLLK